MFKLLRVTTLSIVLMQLLACSSAEKKSDTPEGAYAIAQEFEKEERFEEAIKRYQELRNKFPYSNYATLSELAIADVHFKQESYPEAQMAYQSFRDLHPKHAKSDYVLFRVGLSLYNQVPETVDRDLTLAHDAISNFNDLIRNYANSPHLSEATEKRDDCVKKLAGKEDYIADFYFKRGIYDSALPRYEGLLKNFPGLEFEAQALSRAAISAYKIQDVEKARSYLKSLKKKFPGTSELKQAQKVIE